MVVVEVYDPVIDEWSEVKSMSCGRYNFGAVEVGGKIYCIGGSYSNSVFATVEAYDTGWRYE